MQSNTNRVQLSAEIVREVPETPRPPYKSRWGVVREQLQLADPGDWVRIPLPQEQEGQRARRNLLGTLRYRRTGMRLEVKYDRTEHYLYARRKVGKQKEGAK